ncbi:MAG TPA: glycoside hydrolase family 44 protein [Polyangiaceae bacterium]|nr:glycoside hydrolase family 44 protein [Polyangiaceae bacterium]
MSTNKRKAVVRTTSLSAVRGRDGSSSSRISRASQVLGWLVIVSASLCVDCRRLIAEPAKARTTTTRPKSFEAEETIYDAGLKAGWQDWGWGEHDLSQGPAKLNLSQYGGWILHHDPLSKTFGGLVFRMRAPAAAGQFLELRLAGGNGDESFPPVAVGADRNRSLPDGWVESYIPWADLNPKNAPFDRITFRAASSIAGDKILFDKIFLSRVDPKAAREAIANAPSKPASLSVNCRAPGHPISPYIYGVAGEVGGVGATGHRWGGNRSTRYNWQTNATNVGKDWFFENVEGDDYQKTFVYDRSEHAITALTIPMIGWVAKDTTSVGFPVSVYGPQKATDQYRQGAGNGERADGTPVKPNAPTQTSVEASVDFIKRWVTTIAQRDQKSGTRSVQHYILDNEPSLWSANHRDVHPDPLTYDELLDRTIRYGSAIRAADPGGLIAGPAEWGWTAYFYSPKDTAAGVFLRPDRRAHGDVPLLPWYLSKLREHDQTTGVKVLDILDVHYYPQGQDVYSDKSDPDTAALRLRSTRSLWDPTYKDESWINDKVRLIPRLKEWVAQNYPGLKVSLGEYNFGGEKHISGALALAEALGRFGTEGLDYAFYWLSPPKDSPTYWAFRSFRNFDGKNGRFLDQSLSSKMAPDVSLFASRDATGKHLVLIAINLNPTTSAKAKIALDGCSGISTQHRFSYDASAPGIVDQGSKTGGVLSETLPPYSINIFDVVLK